MCLVVFTKRGDDGNMTKNNLFLKAKLFKKYIVVVILRELGAIALHRNVLPFLFSSSVDM